MFFIGHETEENINGEPPPIIYIKGSRNHFHNTLLKLIHKLRLKIFEINIRELGITTDDSISSTDIILKIQDKIELSYRIGALMVGIILLIYYLNWNSWHLKTQQYFLNMNGLRIYLTAP